MSYCRWSSMAWKCDVYAYGDVSGGHTIHVAGNRHVHPNGIPDLPNILEVSTEEFLAAYKVQHKRLDEAKLVPIGLPADGETYHEPTEEAMVERLQELAKMGYNVPEDLLVWPLDEGAG
ncbi:MAG: hypothetical protein V3S82_10290 [Dehalococcoidia bacterium]